MSTHGTCASPSSTRLPAAFPLSMSSSGAASVTLRHSFKQSVRSGSPAVASACTAAVVTPSTSTSRKLQTDDARVHAVMSCDVRRCSSNMEPQRVMRDEQVNQKAVGSSRNWSKG